MVTSLRSLFAALIGLLSFTNLSADPFAWTPSTVIDAPTLAASDVSSCYDSANNRIVAAWLDANTNFPVYSINTNGVWSLPAFIESVPVSTGYQNVFLSYHTQEDRIFAVWTATNNNYYASYSIYSGGVWSVPATIATNIPVANWDVFISYNSSSHQLFATWGGDSLGTPTYSVYNSGSWGSAANIDANALCLNLYTSTNTQQNQVMATFADLNNNNYPSYSIFNGISWGPVGVIDPTMNVTNVFTTYNPVSNETIATWVDDSNGGLPVYSVYNGTSWSPATSISNTPTNGLIVTLFTCYDSVHDQIFVAWADVPVCSPIFSIYKNGVWSAPSTINLAPPGVFQDIFLTFNPIRDEVFATWVDCDTFVPYFSIYQDLNPILILPPTQLQGRLIKNKFLTQSNYFDLLTWRPPSTGLNPSFYKVYRNSMNTLIALVSSTSELKFKDPNPKKQTNTYYVTSVDSNGNESLPANITVKQ